MKSYFIHKQFTNYTVNLDYFELQLVLGISSFLMFKYNKKKHLNMFYEQNFIAFFLKYLI